MTATVFVKTLNARSITLTVNLQTDKVSDLFRKYKQKVSDVQIQNIQLVYAGKKLSQEKMDKKLSEIGISRDAILFQVLRLIGGKKINIFLHDMKGKQHKLQLDDKMTGLQLKELIYNNYCQSLEPALMGLRVASALIENTKKLSQYRLDSLQGKVIIFQEKEQLGLIGGIIVAYEEDQFGMDEKNQTVRMPCGHVIGKKGMTQYVKVLIKSGEYQIACPGQKANGEECRLQWQFPLCRKIGVFTKEELRQFEEGLGKNWIRKQTSECPSCEQRVMKGQLKSNRVKCPKCKYGDYCFNCSKKWINSGFDFCGHQDCGRNLILKKSKNIKTFHMKANDGKQITINTPQLRACPNCFALISFFGGCKHMRCMNCCMQFCWVCLGLKKEGNWPCGAYFDYCGKVAPVQNI